MSEGGPSNSSQVPDLNESIIMKILKENIISKDVFDRFKVKRRKTLAI